MNVNRSDGNNNPAAISRRDFLWAGTAGAVGLGLSRAGQAAWADVAGARCDAVILLWMQGGVSHLDTFDPKPDAPSEIHGPFKAIGTNVPGIQLCEHLPRMARIADKIAFIRSMRHGEGAHERAKSHVLSGCKPLPGVIHPDIGSVVSEELGRRGLQLPQKDVAELPSRSVMCAAGERETLELAKEPEKVRDAYGDSSLGRKCLLARRLVEAGARFVMVDEGGWDHHFRAFDSLVTRLPQFDRAVSALLADLADRGLFDRTMVVFATEFGRSPRINNEAGREHHAGVFSTFLAGGGIRGGQVVGASDARGESPASGPVAPEDLFFTIYKQLGVNTERQYTQTALDRPMHILDGGSTIRELV